MIVAIEKDNNYFEAIKKRLNIKAEKSVEELENYKIEQEYQIGIFAFSS